MKKRTRAELSQADRLKNDEAFLSAVQEALDDARPDGFVYICHGKPRCHVDWTKAEDEDIYLSCQFCFRVSCLDPRPLEEIIDEMVKLNA